MARKADIKILKNQKYGNYKIFSNNTQKTKTGGNLLYECQCNICNKILYLRKDSLLRRVNKPKCLCSKNYGLHGFKGYKEIYSTFWTNLKYQAKCRKLEFSITIEEAWDLFLKQDRKCAYTNMVIKHSHSHKTKNGNTASLDRIDSSKGYTIDNVQWVDNRVNMMKWKLKEEEFLDLINKIHKFKRKTK